MKKDTKAAKATNKKAAAKAEVKVMVRVTKQTLRVGCADCGVGAEVGLPVSKATEFEKLGRVVILG